MTRRMFTSSGGGSPAGRPAKRWLLFIVVSLPLLAQSRRQQFLEHRNVAQRDSAARLVQPPSSLPFQFLATFDDASALPQCSFTAPKNGTVAGCAKVNAGASCQDFKCAVGFRKAGSFRCRKEEQKSGNTTTTLAKNGGVGTCERIFCANATAAKPPKNSTGTFGCTKIASGEKCVDFGCTVGFAKTGQFVCKKGGSGLETSGTCERRYCRADAPKNVSNLTEFNRTCGRVASGETCPKFQCSVGFKATGSFVCAKDGSALTGKGKCERIYCPLVKPPNNISKPDAFNRTCGRLASGTSCKEFVCETGFAPKNSFVCSKDGSRIEERGSCERVFCKAISPPANVKDAAGFNRTCGKLASGTGCKPSGVGVAPKPDGSVGDGSRVTDLGTGGRWQCAAGFGAVGEYQCAKDGLSVVKTGSCVRLLCPDVVKPAHAASSSYSCPALMKANSTCQVSCDVGWRSTAGKSAHVCPITGGKLKTVAQCERVYCEKIPAPANSTNFNCSRIASGESCDVRCAVGFLPAEKTIKCAKNGLSVVQNATCERVFCKVLAVPPHAQGFSCNRIPSGEVCSLKCAVGWAPKGQFKCNPAGTEVVEKGECKRLYCEDIPPPQNASLAKFNCSKIASGDSCDIQCDKGFSVKGKFKCNADATGLDEKPVCDRKKIEKIPAPANSANFKCGSINSGEICKVDCATGYRPVSNFTVDKAGDNLLYNASCERKTCSDIPAPRNSTKFNCMKIKSGELCNITCIHGFDIVDYFQCSKSGEEVVRNATCKPSLLYHQVVRRTTELQRQYKMLLNRTQDVTVRLSKLRARLLLPTAAGQNSTVVDNGVLLKKFRETEAAARTAISRIAENSAVFQNVSSIYSPTNINRTRAEADKLELLNRTAAEKDRGLGNRGQSGKNLTAQLDTVESLWKANAETVGERVRKIGELSHQVRNHTFDQFVDWTSGSEIAEYFGKNVSVSWRERMMLI